MLIFEKTRRIAMFAAFDVMVIFTAYIVAITHFAAYVLLLMRGILQALGWTEHFHIQHLLRPACNHRNCVTRSIGIFNPN